MANLLYPMADVRLYNAGAEGYNTDVGQTVYDIVAKNYAEGIFSDATGTVLNGKGQALMIVGDKEINGNDGLFMMCQPQTYPVNMVLTDFTLTGTDCWETVAGPTYFNTTYMRQKNVGTPETPVDATAITKWYYPEGMPIAFQIIMSPAAPAKRQTTDETDEANEEKAAVWVTFGNDEFGLKVMGTTASLYRWVLNDGVGEWKLLGEFNPPEAKVKLGDDKNNSNVMDFFFISVRNELWLMNGAKLERVPDATLAAGPLKVQFKGCAGGFAIHKVFMEEGTYDSPMIPLFEDRTGQTPVKRLEVDYHFLQPQHFNPLDGDLEYDYCDVDEVPLPLNPGKFSYQAWLKPKVLPVNAGGSGFNAPFLFYDTPCLMAVEYEFAAVIVPPDPAGHVHLTDYGVLDIHIDLPEDLDAGTASVTMMLDPRDSFTGEYRRRYIEIDIGHAYDDGTYYLWPTLAGYIVSVRTRGQEGWRTGHTLEFQIIDASYVSKQTTGGTVDESWRPLDGWTPNEALTYCAEKIGIHASRTSWATDTVNSGLTQLYLSVGPAENPIWWRTGEIKLDMAVWDVMTLIASTMGYTLYVAPDGVWTTNTRNYYTGTTYNFDAAGSYPMTAASLEYEAAALSTGTAVIATGDDTSGKMIAAWYINFDKERTPGTDLFAGRRLWRRLTGVRFNDLSDAISAAANEFAVQSEDNYNLYWQSPLNPQVLRNDWVTISNAEGDGVNPAHTHIIGSITHDVKPTYDAGTSSSFKARRVLEE